MYSPFIQPAMHIQCLHLMPATGPLQEECEGNGGDGDMVSESTEKRCHTETRRREEGWEEKAGRLGGVEGGYFVSDFLFFNHYLYMAVKPAALTLEFEVVSSIGAKQFVVLNVVRQPTTSRGPTIGRCAIPALQRATLNALTRRKVRPLFVQPTAARATGSQEAEPSPAAKVPVSLSSVTQGGFLLPRGRPPPEPGNPI